MTFIVLELEKNGSPSRAHGTFNEFEEANDCARKLKAGGAAFATVFELEPLWLTRAMTDTGRRASGWVKAQVAKEDGQ